MRIWAVLIATVFTLFSGSIFAGAVQPYIPVSVDLENRYASGNMLAARASNNKVEHIGCYANAYADGSTNGGCLATDPEGNQIWCTFSDKDALARAALSLSDYSFVMFAWDEAENCIFIRVSHRSFYLPKK